jgi:hypothetical protein
MVAVSVIANKGASSLIQWDNDGTLSRAFVPGNSVVGDKCKKSVINASVPYGSRWVEFIPDILIPGEIVADALRAAGFWTFQDIELNVNGAQSAINKAVGVNAATICRLARNSEREAKT